MLCRLCRAFVNLDTDQRAEYYEPKNYLVDLIGLNGLMSSANAPARADSLPSEPHVVIIGGGITGLAAAYHLQKQARATGMPLRYTLVERDERLGGKIITDRLGDTSEFVVEGGPDSFVARKPWAIDLVRELGLGDDVIGTNKARHSTYVLRHGRLTPLPAGLGMIAPTQWLPFLRSPLFSPWGKLRMALEQALPARRDDDDETLANFIRRRFGQEALDLLGEPLLAAIHSGVANQQSMLATFPNFRAMEREHGSVTRAARKQAAKARQSGAQSAAFVSLRGGIGTLVGALVPRLAGTLLTGRAVTALEPGDNASGYRVQLDDGTVLHADALIVTTPAYAAADLVDSFSTALAQTLREIPYVSTGTLTLAYRRSEVGTPLDGFGVVIPRSEGRRINACTMSSLKFPHRAPDDYLLVRVFVGGTNRPDLLHLDDDALCNVVRDELRNLLGITAAPVWSRIYRWWNANPQYNLGHLERVDRIAALCPPGLFLSGSAYRGVGIPDCVRQAQEAAEQAFLYVQQHVCHLMKWCSESFEDSKNENVSSATDSSTDEWVTLQDASDLLGVATSTVRRWADAGRVPMKRTLGGHRRFSRAAILQLAQIVARRNSGNSSSRRDRG